MLTGIIIFRGLLARSIIQAQSYSPTYSNVYAAVVAVINSHFPNIGMLIIHRLLIQFKRCYKRNDKTSTVTVSKFIAHLINQQVVRILFLSYFHQPLFGIFLTRKFLAVVVSEVSVYPSTSQYLFHSYR